jgi:hypothetical protein
MEMDGTSEKVENSTTQDKNDIIIESGKKYENGIKIFEGLSATIWVKVNHMKSILAIFMFVHHHGSIITA